ncbi:MAG: OmpA family protein [Polyangiaceae bacterium]|nr:OmpA family protein [Polyangiaceae bacterium]
MLVVCSLVGVGSWAAVNFVFAPAAQTPAVVVRVGTASPTADPGHGREAPAPRASAEQSVASAGAAGGLLAPSAVPTGEGAMLAASGSAAPEGVASALPPPTGRLPFARRSVRFEPTTRNEIFSLVRRLNAEPDRKVRLVGHGDPGSDGAGAATFAERRAEVVRQFLVTLGIEAGRVSASAAPVLSVDESEGGATNRTVEVFIE